MSTIETRLVPAPRSDTRAGRSRWRRPGFLAAIAVVALIGASCTSPPAGTDAGGTGSGGGTTNDSQRQAIQFAQCMRDHGVPQFPDPDPSGGFTIENVANGTSIDTNSQAFRQAITACKDLEPPGFTGTGRSPEQQQAALKFARCMRDNGVNDFPDPGLGDPLVDTRRIPSSATAAGMSILHAAMKKCSTFLQAAGVTR